MKKEIKNEESDEEQGVKEVESGKVSVRCPVCKKVWNKNLVYCPECGISLRQKASF